MRLINKLFNKKNDDYYTASKDISVLNDKPDKVHNGFTKFMIRMLQIIILAILESIILGSIIALVYYCYNTFNPILFKLVSTIIGIGLVFGYIIYIMTDNPSNYIPDKLENDDDN